MDQIRAEAVRAIAREYAALRGPLLPVLHAIQDRFGSMVREDTAIIADVLNLSVADVHGVVSFYDDFRATPPPTHLVTICRGEACQAVGSEALFAELSALVRSDPDVEIREVFCLGNCALGPSGTVDGRLLARLTSRRVADEIQGHSS